MASSFKRRSQDVSGISVARRNLNGPKQKHLLAGAGGLVIENRRLMCYKSPWGRGREKRRPSTLAGGPWRRPVDIKLGRNYPRAPHDQGSDRTTTKDCSPCLQRTKIHYFSTILCSLRLRGVVAAEEVDHLGGNFVVHRLRSFERQRTLVAASLVILGAVGGLAPEHIARGCQADRRFGVHRARDLRDAPGSVNVAVPPTICRRLVENRSEIPSRTQIIGAGSRRARRTIAQTRRGQERGGFAFAVHAGA
jgi:hypothetical protein